MLKASAAVMEMRSFGAGKSKIFIFFLQYRTDVVVFLNGTFTLTVLIRFIINSAVCIVKSGYQTRYPSKADFL